MIKRFLYKFWKAIVILTGIILLILGVIGLFLPILQGILMIGAGLYLIGRYWDIKMIRDLNEYIRKWMKARKKAKSKS